MDYNLIAKYLSGELSLQERVQFEKQIQKDTSLKNELEGASITWNDAGYCKLNENEYINSVYAAFKNKTKSQSPPVPNVLLNIYKSAAAVLIIGASAFLFSFLNKSEFRATNEKINVTLADNSTVVLNKNSILVARKWINKRTVQLNGEAYFDIVHDENSPFVVNTFKSEVKVLGTSFYVSAFEPRKKTQVKVTSGKVMLSGDIRGKNGNRLILTEGEMGEVNYQANTMVKFDMYDVNDFAWNTGKLVFKSQPLGEVFDLIMKTYNLEIKANFTDIENYNFTGTFDNTDIDIVLETISRTFELRNKRYIDQGLVIFY